MTSSVPFSILDLAPIRQGEEAQQAFGQLRERAQRAEQCGFNRYWLAEHHNMSGIGSAATSVLIGHIAGATDHIRVGSGGIMLPNHAPLVIAEQFGTLESLYPGRIDLGLGRAPGTDFTTARALRRNLEGSDQDFPRDVVELQNYFRNAQHSHVRAVPGAGLNVPVWLLGSSLFSAQLAGMLGLPYAFASHFAPDYLMDALAIYRSEFKPSDQLTSPYAMVGTSIVGADSEEHAHRLLTSQQVQSVQMMRGEREKIAPPVDDIEAYWTSAEKEAVDHKLRYALVGTVCSLTDQISELVAETRADELIATVRIFDQAASLRSLEILAAAGQALSSDRIRLAQLV